MKKTIVAVLLAAILGACSKPSPEQQAAEAAQQYYQLLANGDVVRFLEGKIASDTLPGDYCEQLLAVYRQYLSDVNEKHGGISQVAISPNVGRADSTLQLTYTFLLLHFRDSTQEEITVPMVEHDGLWRMR